MGITTMGIITRAKRQTLVLRLGSGLLVLMLGQGVVRADAEDALPLANLPAGQYYYQTPSSTARVNQGYLLLRKAGHTVIGLDRRSRSGSACFRGFLEGDRIVNVTRVLPPYQPDSRLEAQRGEWLNLDQYQRLEHTPTDEDTEALRTCIGFFWR